MHVYAMHCPFSRVKPGLHWIGHESGVVVPGPVNMALAPLVHGEAVWHAE